MNKIKIVILIVILVTFLFALHSDAFGGYGGFTPQQQAYPNQAVGHEVVKFEIWKWASGVSTVLIGVGLTYYLNKKKQKND